MPYRENRPYAHVKVPEQSARLRVAWHDGSTTQDRISGELWCTLTALTPFLAGNEQYKVKDAQGADRVPTDQGLRNRLAQLAQAEDVPKWVEATVSHVVRVQSWFGDKLLHDERTVIEPLRDTHGRVLIPGQHIKGMVRQSIGALLGAPMERVWEQSYSYRPNLMWPNTPVVLEPRPAVVQTVREVPSGDKVY
ncbi:MAG: hypothetical protein ACREC6_08465, partial [Hyphomicrobiaceae bacterium]